VKKNIVRLIFLCSLSLTVSLALAQRSGGGGHSSGGGGGGHFSGGGGGSHFSGGGGFSGGSRSSGGSYSHSFSGSSGFRSDSSSGGSFRSGGGGYSRYSGGSFRSGGATDSRSFSSNYGSRFGQGSTSSRSQSGSGSFSAGRGSSGVYHRSALGSSSGTRSTSGGNGGFEQGHAAESRSGTVHYSGNHNLFGSTGNAIGQRIGSGPRGAFGNNSGLGRVIGGGRFGHEGFRHDGFDGGFFWRGGFRFGYFGYGLGWNDGFFCFPFYCFDPFIAPCYWSPWYYYPCLPPYVAESNVIVETASPYPSRTWRDYDWAPESRSSSNPVLDDSVEDIVQSFEADDHKAIDRVTAHSGNVRIDTDGKYSYSLKANDFYDTYVDGIESTKTDRYQVVNVQASPDGSSARVVAKHIYNDPWGNRTSVYHSYLLVKEGDEYVIREFGTSNAPIS